MADDAGGSKQQRTRTTAEATTEGLRLFVSSLQWHVGEDILRRDFGECGVIEDLFLMRDETGKSKGRAFITFREKSGATAGLAFDGTDYGGRKLTVKPAEYKGPVNPRTRDPSQKDRGLKALQNQLSKPARKELPSNEKPEGCRSICIKSLAPEATDGDVRALLEGCRVQSVRIVYDRITGESRGVAFVDFVTTECVDTAMSFNGTELKGQTIVMRYEAPKVRPRPEGCMGVVIKKLGPDTTEADIHELFQGLVKRITQVRIITEPSSKKCNGMAFVDFNKERCVESAVTRSGMKVHGRTIFIGYETRGKQEKPQAEKAKKTKAEGESADAEVSVKTAKPKEKKEQPKTNGTDGKKKAKADPTQHEPKKELDEAKSAKKREKRKRDREKRKEAKKAAAAATAEPAGEAQESAEGESPPQAKKKKKKTESIEAGEMTNKEKNDGADDDEPAKKKAKKAKKQLQNEE